MQDSWLDVEPSRISPHERRLLDAERQLFVECGVAPATHFLWPGERERQVRIFDLGEGQPLLMLHGGNSVAATWAPLWQRLRGYRVLAPDRPGCGLTHAQDYAGIDFDRHAVEFVREVMDAARLEQTALVGNSMGGYWALLFALAHPERVERVILLGEPAGSTKWPTAKHRLGGTPVLNRLLFATVARPRPDRRLFRGLMADPGRASESLIEVAHAAAQIPGAALAWRSMLENVAAPWRPSRLTYALGDRLRRLSVPVLLAWGDDDFAPLDAGREIAQRIPGARFEVVADAGHLVWLDQPEEVARLLTA